MKVIDPGHVYSLDQLDWTSEWNRIYAEHHPLTFVKREGPGFPGNVGHHPGTNLQEVLRACIHRVRYLDQQIPDQRNSLVIDHLRQSLYLLEKRAADRHHRLLSLSKEPIELQSTCPTCRHIHQGACHA